MSEKINLTTRQGVKLNAYLSVIDVADCLGVSPSTVREYTKKGLLPDHRNPFNGYRMYRRTDVDELVKTIRRVEKEAGL